MPRERHIVHVDPDRIWQTWQSFLTKYYPDDVFNFGRNYRNNTPTSLFINFGHVVSYDRTLADAVINDFGNAHGAISQAIGDLLSPHFPSQPVFDEDINIRFSGLTTKTSIKMLRHDDINRMVSIDGIVRLASNTYPRYEYAIYRCTQCHTPTDRIRQQPWVAMISPTRNCDVCQRKTRMELVETMGRKIDVQHIKLQDSPEGMTGGEQPQTIDIEITGDICGKVFTGDHVTVNGILKSYHRSIRGRVSPNLNYYIEANNVEIREKQFSQIKLNDEEREQIEILSQEPGLFEKLIGSYAPSIYGHNEEKLAILLQMASGIPKINPDGSKTRGDSHILLCGDPSCVSAGTLVTMADGSFRRIETMKNCVGKKIAIDPRGPQDSRTGIIQNFFAYENVDTIRIITETGKQLDVTPDHPLWYYKENKSGTFKTRNFEKKWVRASDLKVGDRIKVSKQIRSLRKSYVPLTFSAFGHKDVKLPEVCDETIAWLWGYMVGDGSIQRMNGVPYKINLYFNEAEQDTMRVYIKDFHQVFGVNPRITVRLPGKYPPHELNGNLIIHKQSTTQMDYDSKTLATFFDMAKSKVRIVPEVILSSKDSVIAKFLAGLFEADGCVFIAHTKDRDGKAHVQLKSASNRLLRDVQVLLIRFGIQGRINQMNLVIRRQDDIIRFAEKIGFISQKKRDLMDRAVMVARSYSKYLRTKFQYEKIVSIEPAGKQAVYDIEVENHHRFISDGIVSHNTAKSKLIKYATLIAPRGIYTSGESSTKAGLTAAAVKDETGEGRWSLEAGAFVLADMGMAIVDEFDKMDDKDRTAMHSVMEGQTVDISKVGMTASLNARCSILAAANPKLARFDMMAPIADQINLPTTILSRFDLIFPVSDIPNTDTDTLISSHILKLHSIGEKRARGMVVNKDEAIDVLPVLEPTFLRKYISHAKTIIPMMNVEAREEIQSFYLRIRSQYDATKTVPITARQLEALIRLTEASARLRLSQTVEKQDVERVIGLVMFSLNKVAYDTDKGVFDSDMVSGISKGRRDLLSFIGDIIERYDPHTKAIRHQDLVRELINAGHARNDLDADKKIKDLMNSTMMIELPHKMYKRFT